MKKQPTIISFLKKILFQDKFQEFESFRNKIANQLTDWHPLEIINQDRIRELGDDC